MKRKQNFSVLQNERNEKKKKRLFVVVENAVTVADDFRHGVHFD